MGERPRTGRFAAGAVRDAVVRAGAAAGAVVLLAVTLLGTVLDATAWAAESNPDEDSTGLVRGVVRDALGPVAFAGVVLTPVTADRRPRGDVIRVSSDSQGRFEFSSVPVGPVTLLALAASPQDVDTWWPDAFTADAAGLLDVQGPTVTDLTLATSGQVTGRVVDADSGAPVPGVRVLADLIAEPGIEPLGRARSGTDDGRYQIEDLPPAPIALLVQLPVGSPYLGTWFRTDRTGPSAQVVPGEATAYDIKLHRGAAISGTVTDSSGAGVEEALVSMGGCASPCPEPVRTDERGRYRLAGIPPDPGVYVTVWAAGEPPLGLHGEMQARRPERFTLGFGQEVSGYDFTVPTAARVSGHVYGVDQQEPLTGVLVMLRSVGDPNVRYLARFGSVTDPAEFSIGPVPAGSYWMVVRPNARLPGYRPVRWASSQGIPMSGLLDLLDGSDLEVVVRLATRTFLPVREATQWPGLDPGFLASEPISRA